MRTAPQVGDVSRETSRPTYLRPVDRAAYGPVRAPGPRRPPTAAQVAAALTPRADTTTPLAAATEHRLLASRAPGAAHRLARPAGTRVLAVANQKGGVGKTTTTVNLAAALAQHGLRVLIVDLDPQGNASTALGVGPGERATGVYDVLADAAPLESVLQTCPHLPTLAVAPATIDLAGAEVELVPQVARESRLRRALQAHLDHVSGAGERYDYVFLDCPPSLGLLTVNALVAASEVLVPIQCEYYALEGLTQLLSNVDLVRAHLNPELAVTTVLLTMYDPRTRLAAGVAAEVRADLGDAVLRTAIPRSVRISEAPGHGQTVMTYDPGSPGALSYLEAARELAGRAVPAAARAR